MAHSHDSQSDSIPNKRLFSVLVMDRSASMARFGQVPLRVINNHLERLRQSPFTNAQEVSVVLFDHATDTLVPMRPISKVGALPPYPLGSGTRLHGTVADVIERLIRIVLAEQSQGVHALASVVVFTDGEDRSKPAGKHLARLRRVGIEAQDLGFQLMAIGIGISGTRLAEELWFPSKLAKTTDPDGVELVKVADEVSELIEDFSAVFMASKLPAGGS